MWQKHSTAPQYRNYPADKQPLFWCQQKLRVGEKLGLKIAETLS